MAWAVNIDDPSKPCNTGEYAYANGDKAAVGPATDGELWYTTALILAGKRWNRPDWVARAKANLTHYVAPRGGDYTALFDVGSLLPVFAPNNFSKGPGAPAFSSFTDPAYVIPSFAAVWATYPELTYPWASAADAGARVLRCGDPPDHGPRRREQRLRRSAGRRQPQPGGPAVVGRLGLTGRRSPTGVAADAHGPACPRHR